MIALSTTRVLAYLAAIFVAGALAGGIGGYSLARNRTPKAPPSPPDSKLMVQHTIERLETRLKLSPQQLGRIRDIVEQSFAEAQCRSSNHIKEVGDVFRRMNTKISEHLDSNQKVEFDRMEKERRDKMRWGRSKTPPTPEPRSATNCPP